MSVGRGEYLQDGSFVKIDIKDPIPNVINPTESAIHESYHINADPDIVEGATINSSADYLAATFVSRYSRKAAGASMHLSGHGHDENIILSHGDSPSQAAMEADAVLAGKEKQIHAVASALDIEKSISGDRAREIIDQVTKGEEAEITIINPDGEEEVKTQKVKNGKVEIEIVNFMNEENSEKELEIAA